ncbi:amidohydrolase family protein [Poriferisphaera sp. WC338]|uniref:amidohydrolase family protein n=1 Tax=Poriferisphaera sp. WC338 TaxID=3425129 RepID=UPI003D81BDCE
MNQTTFAYTPASINTKPLTDHNRLGLDYHAEADQLSFAAPIWDAHSHINTPDSARTFLKVMDLYNIEKVWSMTQLENLPALRDIFGERIEFIAVPNYYAKDEPDTFTIDWYNRIEKFADFGVKIAKFWAAPRAVDFLPGFDIQSPGYKKGMHIARDTGMMFMTHIGDPDTWFATHYKDTEKYGSKSSHRQSLEDLLNEFSDIPWIAAHMAGNPEHLNTLTQLLIDHPNLYIDTSATKWMIRELSKQPRAELLTFLEQFPDRVFFGSDIVTDDNHGADEFDLYASRYWALRTLWETAYAGPSPIVDPDLHLVDPSQPENATAHLQGQSVPASTLQNLYHDAAKNFFANIYTT